MNIFPNTGPSGGNPNGGFSVIRLAGGTIQAFDLNGNPINIQLPAGSGIPANWPLNHVGAAPATVVSNL